MDATTRRHAILGVLWIAACLPAVLSWDHGTSAGPGVSWRIAAARNAAHIGRIRDGVVPQPGEQWDGDRAAVLWGNAHVTVHLTAPAPIRALWITADHNDTLAVDIASPGEPLRERMRIPAVAGPGLQPRRVVLPQSVRAHAVRLRVVDGDGWSSVGELCLFTRIPPHWPSPTEGDPAPDPMLRRAIAWIAALLLAAVWLSGPRRPWWIHWGCVLPIACHVLAVVPTIRETYPFAGGTVAFVRMIAAAVALGAVARIAAAHHRVGARFGPPSPPVVHAVLGVTALSAVACFANLGAPQFRDARTDSPEWVHLPDMQMYFPLARYADELGYDGLYAALVAALVEIHPEVDTPALDATPIRDLRDHRLRPIGALRDHIASVRTRFSPKRWAAFTRDAAYFIDAMGTPFTLRNLRDHGGNATPVWLALTRLLFHGRPAGTTLLRLGALADWALLLLLGVAMTRAFGWPAAAVALTVFGANDFYMGGTNWTGATLRHDWLLLIGLSLCALRVGRYALGGALLMAAALIRAFPGMGFVAIAAVTCAGMLIHWVTHRRSLGWRSVVATYAPVWRTAAGALAAAAVLVGLSLLVYSPHLWVQWWDKINSLNASAHVNNVSLQAVVSASTHGSLRALSYQPADWQQIAAQVVHQRAWILAVLRVLLSVPLLWAAFGRPLWQQAALGMGLIPIWLDPANYYHHLVYIIPLLACTEDAQRPEHWGPAAVGLLLCIAQYGTVHRTFLDDHYLDASVLLLIAWCAVAALLLAARPVSRSPA